MTQYLRTSLEELLPGIDNDALEYFESMVVDGDKVDVENLKETLAPFIESFGLASDISGAEAICDELCVRLKSLGMKNDQSVVESTVVLDKMISFSKSNLSEAEQATVDTLWGFDKIREKRNDTLEVTEAGSAKYERKAMKEQKKWLEDLESKFVGEEDDGSQITSMTLPDLSGNNGEKDIHVHDFNVTFGGQILLENADLRLVYGRRYGLVGRNGIGKTTLLRHMANFDIEGFPRHHRVLHVKQEVQSSDQSVLDVVLASDVERMNLLDREKILVALQQSTPDDSPEQQQIVKSLSEVYDRMEQIGAQSAEGRAAVILSGLQ
eukprot:gene5273-10553_t